MEKGEEPIAIIDNDQIVRMIHIVRGIKVMLDSDLASIYGYSTKDFNRQVKNNIEKFDEDFMFQLTAEETSQLSRWKKSTLNNPAVKAGRGQNIKYCPYAFTEQGVYMLMTVLKGNLATKQSKAIIRLFKGMKDYVLENQPLLYQREYLQLSMQITDNYRELLNMRATLTEVDEKVARMADDMGEAVTHSELSDIILDFSHPIVRQGWLVLQGQPVESDLAYQQIYSKAKKSVIVFDNYPGLKTLVLLRSVPQGIPVTIVTDNIKNSLHKIELDDYVREYPENRIRFLKGDSMFHDRYIVIDYLTTDERIYHCGASSKDGGNKVMTIDLISDSSIYHPLIEQALAKGQLNLQ